LKELVGRKHFERRCTKRGISENMIYDCLKHGIEEIVYRNCSKKKIRLIKVTNKYITLLYNPNPKPGQLVTAWLNDDFEETVRNYANKKNITMFKAIANLVEIYNGQEAV